jgi:predicted kinase
MRMSDARPVPRLHVVCGPPAAGKTVYGRALAERERAVLLDIDIATEPVVQAGMEAAGLSRDDRDSPSYKEIFREPAYEALFQLAEANLAQLPVVVVGPFTRESQDAAWPARLEGRFEVPVEVHFVFCQPEVRRARMIARGEDRDLAKLEKWDEYLRTTAEEQPVFPHVWVDTGS